VTEQRDTGSGVETARKPSAAKRLLQGRPLGHPLHPMLVHLPIGLWFLSFALDVIALFTDPGGDAGSTALAKATFYLLVLGLAGALLAIVTGFADYMDVRKDHPARGTATWHMALNLAAFVVFGLSALLRLDVTGFALMPAIVSAVGIVLVGVSGYLGGVMVYDDGLAVGRHRRAHEPPPETLKVNAPADDGYVDVMDTDDLAADVPTRVDINGHVIVLLRHEGQVYAFQEFCTHRFGPLSEGKMDDKGNIMCPWHRSCFDVRTGKVANGPAKVDLKTYETREEAGRLSVRVPNR
jgi:nitrite reductase/ring-hydroxylating ferredoxin subunit/uncharacterized membrane protein